MEQYKIASTIASSHYLSISFHQAIDENSRPGEARRGSVADQVMYTTMQAPNLYMALFTISG
jgi:hypothetical protein